jgi:hypothetical protein
MLTLIDKKLAKLPTHSCSPEQTMCPQMVTRAWAFSDCAFSKQMQHKRGMAFRLLVKKLLLS